MRDKPRAKEQLQTRYSSYNMKKNTYESLKIAGLQLLQLQLCKELLIEEVPLYFSLYYPQKRA
jgi:hypothetical protein